MRLRLALLFLQLPIWAGLCAGAPEYGHRVWRTEDGLPQNRVQAIAQTADGYLWIGTSEGLARFDGLRFLIFDRSNTPAIADNSVVSLEAARDGSLWIGTEGGGLLHEDHGVFQAFGERDGLTNSFVRVTHLDAAGVLWVGTDRGFFRYSNHRFTRLDNTPEIPLVTVTGIAEDTSGKLWVATAGGLFIVDQGKLRNASCEHAPEISGEIALALLRERLIPNGCAAPPAAIRDLRINSVHREAAGTEGLGNLWLGTFGKGLISINPNTGERTAFEAPSVLPDNTVFRVFEDAQHNIWAGAQDGLVRLSRSVVSTVGTGDGLQDDNVSTTYEDRAGVLWLTTFSGQLYRLEGGIPRRYYLPSPVRDLRFRNVFMDSRGDYWFGTAGSGVVHLSKGKATRLTKENGLRSDSIREIFEDSGGRIWFATSSGLSRWDGTRFTSYYLEDGLSYPSVRCFGETPEGDILAGTDAGLNRIHQGRIVGDSFFSSLKHEKIWSLSVSGRDVWLGTRGGGLVLLRDNRIFRFTTREGMVSNSIYQIIDDHAGRMWLSSPVGIFSVRFSELERRVNGDQTDLHATAYGSADGMLTGQMYGGIQPAGCRRGSGELWFPSVRGAVRVDPSHLPVRRSGPALIESISAGDVALPLSGEVAIPSGHGRIEIDFTACNLVAPQQVRFRYKLEGFDESWITATRPRSAFYSNLSPGRYKFRVIAEDTGSLGASSEASLAIFQTPAFYQEVWFYLLLALAAVCVTAAGVWAYARQTKARFALLLNERTRVAREMHDTVIQGCVGVSALLEAVARFQKSNVQEAAQLLAHARVQIKETLDEARQAVWNLRKPDSSQSPITDLLSLAHKLGKEHGVAVDELTEGEQTRLPPLTERTILLVGREALRNAVLHAQPTLISIRLSFDATRVRMEVRDDGKGFDTRRQALGSDGHFGIIGMRERVEQSGGIFGLQSRPGQGTVVSVSVPVTHASMGASEVIQNSTIPR